MMHAPFSRFSKGGRCAVLILAAAVGAPSLVVAQSVEKPYGRWAVSNKYSLTIVNADGKLQPATHSGADHKPSWSSDGKRITFFRASHYGGNFELWRTKIGVVNADGSGEKLLTGGTFADFNPTWMRDGSNRIVFNRYLGGATWTNQIFITTPDARPGEEIQISAPHYRYFEWANSTLKDGRIFVDRIDGAPNRESFLLMPNPGGTPKYEKLRRPTDKVWQKLSVSPSETKVTYMLDYDGWVHTYQDAVIAWAKFDVAKRRVFDDQIISEQNTAYIDEYPRWSKDERYILYDSNRSGRYEVYAYDLQTHQTRKLSEGQYPNFEATPY